MSEEQEPQEEQPAVPAPEQPAPDKFIPFHKRNYAHVYEPPPPGTIIEEN